VREDQPKARVALADPQRGPAGLLELRSGVDEDGKVLLVGSPVDLVEPRVLELELVARAVQLDAARARLECLGEHVHGVLVRSEPGEGREQAPAGLCRAGAGLVGLCVAVRLGGRHHHGPAARQGQGSDKLVDAGGEAARIAFPDVVVAVEEVDVPDPFEDAVQPRLEQLVGVHAHHPLVVRTDRSSRSADIPPSAWIRLCRR
jgi:hypothetical protein